MHAFSETKVQGASRAGSMWITIWITAPPFRADQVGSLLRPQSLKHARERFAAGQISRAELKSNEDREIINLIGKQEGLGIPKWRGSDCS